MLEGEVPLPNRYFDRRREDEDLFQLPARTHNEIWEFESEHMLVIKDAMV
jgi:hypothetical protein